MRTIEKIALILAAIITLLLILGIWYQNEFSMKAVKEYTINDPTHDRKLVIATQGSQFKDSVTAQIVAHYSPDSIFIRVIDVSKLPKINMKDYEAMVLMHTWENWEPPAVVDSFIAQLEKTEKNKVVVFTTSGEGGYKMENIDAMAGESNLELVPETTTKIIAKLHPLIAKN